MIQEWLMTTLQLLVAGLAVTLVALSTQLDTGPGLTGASLVTLLSFGEVLADLIRNYTALETSIGAVSRLRSFSEGVVPEDKSDEDIIPPPEWPHCGLVDIKNVSASYYVEADGDYTAPSHKDLVVKSLSLTITPGQKLAICGRTGSGKSTLILLLLRLLDPLPSCGENMEIDGLPVHRINRAALRKRLIAIPQDPVFLPDGSSVKSNVDPFAEATGEECVAALATVKLSAFVTDRGGLDAGMSAADLSAGQKQLFSLGRAVLRKRVRDRLTASEKRGGILLLDEVSSSVDRVTDREMQEIIRQEFDMYTIIMVSHRLDMVVEYFDRVIVLDQGTVIEDGHPGHLKDNGSRFGELWAHGKYEPREITK